MKLSLEDARDILENGLNLRDNPELMNEMLNRLKENGYIEMTFIERLEFALNKETKSGDDMDIIIEGAKKYFEVKGGDKE